MSDYRVNLLFSRDRCPFDQRKKNKTHCQACKAWDNPCPGIGIENTIVNKKISKETMQKILAILK